MRLTALKLTAIAAVLSLSSCGNGGEDIVNVIPEPNYVKLLGGSTEANEGIVEKINDPKLGEEEYVIEIRKGRVTVKASALRGFLYAQQTLDQLRDADGEWPDVIIRDRPRFAYRGMHLDCARHFFSVDELKRYIDMMAVHKMNKFHWHLTDDQGWRIEIRKYPLLTKIGAWRKGEKLFRPDGSGGDPTGALYGGYYTQEQLREVVVYAAERGIDVIPEIDLPGHMQAELAAYPELGCEGYGPYEVWNFAGVSPDVLCAGNEKTYEFLEGVLDEVLEIFPSKYIHIGGDECPKDHWATCPRCQAKIAELGLKGDGQFSAEHYLQSGYVTARVEKFLNEHGRSIIGWDEILEGELSPNATVMSWRGSAGGQKAAALGHDAIMTPTTHFYFDYCQSLDRASEPDGIGGYLPVSKVYEYEPFTPEMTDTEKKHILGIQANLWTEYIATPEHLEYMLLPRMSALAEVQWCDPGRRDADRFFRDLDRMCGIYEAMGYNYAKHIYEVLGKVSVKDGCYLIELKTAGDTPIRYTTDGSDPTDDSPLYTGPFTLTATPCTVKAATFRHGERSKVWTQELIANKAFGKKLWLNSPKANGYDYLSESALNDGIRGNWNYSDGRWVAWNGAPMDVSIDMNGEKCSEVSVGFIINTPNWIFGPLSLKVYGDGVLLGWLSIPEVGASAPDSVENYSVTFPETEVGELRVVAEDTRVIPSWHGGKGHTGFLFVDEILVK